MKRTVVISQVFPPQVGGSGRWLWEIYRRLPTEAAHVITDQAIDSDRFDAACPLSINRLPMSLPDLGGLWPVGCHRYASLARRIKFLTAGKGVRALHAGKLVPEGWLARKLSKRIGVPFACFVHGEEIPIYQSSRELAYMARRTARASQVLIANSVHTFRRVAETWPDLKHKAVVLHPGVDAAKYLSRLEDHDYISKMGWSHRSVVLTVGRLQTRKGHDRMIEALPEIRKSIPNILYAIVGDGPERGRLIRLAKDFGVSSYVQFGGEVTEEDLIACYQNCDLFVLPNRTVGDDFEGFGMVLVEAQACGKAVIAGRSGGVAETMDPGRTGLIIDCSNPSEIAENVVALLQDTDRRRLMGETARQLVLERFDWNVLINRAEEIFQDVAERGGGQPDVWQNDEQAEATQLT